MVFLEANAAGKAVVGGQSGGTADSIQHGVTGLMVNPQDVDEVASALKRLLTNTPLRQKLGDAGLRRAREEFSWGSRARKLRQVSSQILQEVHCRAPKQTAREFSVEAHR
jgi:phosphatidylinositol alpha-1,6-mannosyltransferase